jgi:hypothetical protein
MVNGELAEFRVQRSEWSEQWPVPLRLAGLRGYRIAGIECGRAVW